MRHFGQSGRLLWAVSLGFAAGVAFVTFGPWSRGPSIPASAGSSPRTAAETSVNRPAEAQSPVAESRYSLPQKPEGSPLDRVARATQARETVDIIVARNIFSKHRTAASKSSSSSPSEPSATAETGAQTQTQARQPLPFRLLGTVASEERDSYAVLEATETKVQDIYRVGQTIGDARIDRIEQNRVVVLRDGRREVLELVLTAQPPAPTPAAAVAALPPAVAPPGPEDLVRVATNGNRQINTAVSSSEASHAAQSFLRRIRLSPSIVDGESVGLSISGLEDSTMAQLIGLKDGDVIQSVNRHPVTSRSKAVQVLSKARRLGSAELGLMRDQESKSLVFRTSSW